MSEIKLLPCPFCGGEAEVYEQKHREYASTYYVRCKSCHCKTIERIGKGIVIEQWNTRKPMEQIVERLEELDDLTLDQYNRSMAGTYEHDFADGKSCGLELAIEIVKEVGGIE